jgi:hypothetical protein
MISLNERHLRRLLIEWLGRYSRGRLHSSPEPRISDSSAAFLCNRPSRLRFCVITAWLRGLSWAGYLMPAKSTASGRATLKVSAVPAGRAGEKIRQRNVKGFRGWGRNRYRGWYLKHDAVCIFECFQFDPDSDTDPDPESHGISPRFEGAGESTPSSRG